MTVQDLIEMLQEMPNDWEVRLAEQPTYPFEYSIEGITAYKGVVFVCEGRQLGYADGEIWEHCWDGC